MQRRVAQCDENNNDGFGSHHGEVLLYDAGDLQLSRNHGLDVVRVVSVSKPGGYVLSQFHARHARHGQQHHGNPPQFV